MVGEYPVRTRLVCKSATFRRGVVSFPSAPSLSREKGGGIRSEDCDRERECTDEKKT